MPNELPESIKLALVVLCANFSAKHDIPVEEVIRFAMALNHICMAIPDDKEEVVH